MFNDEVVRKFVVRVEVCGEQQRYRVLLNLKITSLLLLVPVAVGVIVPAGVISEGGEQLHHNRFVF